MALLRREDRRPWRTRRRRTRWRIAAWIAGPLLVVLVVLGIFAAVRLATIAHDLDHARGLLDSASANVEAGQLGAARDELTQAQELLTKSNSRLYNNVSLDVLSILPVFHQNLDSLRSTVGLALRMTDGGTRILAITKPLEGANGHLEVPLLNGAIPLDAVHAAKAATEQLAAALPLTSSEPSSSLLLGPVKKAQHLLYQQAGRRRVQLDNVSRGLDLLASLSGDSAPRRYLIAVANTAEMRGAGGMILSYGTLTSNAGTFQLGDFGRIDDLALDQPVPPTALGLPTDYIKRWEGLDPTLLWRNTTLDPDFAFDAPVMEAMYTTKTGLPVDGVIQIDPAGLAAILQGTGPVQVDSVGQVDATNVVDLTLNRAYIDFPNRDQRQEVLGDVARAAFDALVHGEQHSLRPLGTALYQAAQARHLIFFANDAHDERVAGSFGATGSMPAADTQDYAVLTVQNFSKNKLDYYVDSSVRFEGVRAPGVTGHMRATITVANNAPPNGTANYVFGPNAAGEQRGLYRSIVSLYLPTGTSLASADAPDVTTAPVATSEAGRSVVTFGVDLRPGEQRTVTLDLLFPPRPKGTYAFTLVPVPRVRPTTVAVAIDAGDGTTATRSDGPLQQVQTVSASN